MSINTSIPTIKKTLPISDEKKWTLTFLAKYSYCEEETSCFNEIFDFIIETGLVFTAADINPKKAELVSVLYGLDKLGAFHQIYTVPSIIYWLIDNNLVDETFEIFNPNSISENENLVREDGVISLTNNTNPEGR